MARRAVLALAGIGLAAVVLSLAPAPARSEFRLPPHDARSVYDFASVVKADDAAQMEHWHRALYDKTGVAIVVVTVPDLDGETIEDFATRVGTEWGVGKRARISASSSRCRSSRGGSGRDRLRRRGISPGRARRRPLDSEVMPRLRQGRFLGRVAAGERGPDVDIGAAVREDDRGADQTRPAGRRNGPVVLPGLIFLAIVVVIFLAVVRNPLLAAILFSTCGIRGAVAVASGRAVSVGGGLVAAEGLRVWRRRFGGGGAGRGF